MTSSTYADTMLARTRTAFDKLHEGVGRLHFTDFPDHANIGDGAISEGQFAYWRAAGIDVLSTSSFHTLRPRVYRARDTVFINGGGNFGGLYRVHSEHRYGLAERLPEDTLLIQGAQSVHWASSEDREEFLRRMAPRKRLRIAVRDQQSYDDLKDHVDVQLSPDAVHMLGMIPAPEPTQKEVRLVRRDPEATGNLGDGIDWPKDRPFDRSTAWLSHRTKEIPALRDFIPSSPALWEARSRRRLTRGIEILGRGETIVTDRLHAMLIGLQLGRHVAVKDNKIGKLRKYHDTWLAGAGGDITWL